MNLLEVLGIEKIEMLQANWQMVLGVFSFVCGLSVAGYWVGKENANRDNAIFEVFGTLFSIASVVGIYLMVKDIKLGLMVSVGGYLLKSILLLIQGFGVGAFVRPLMFFKKAPKPKEIYLDI